MAIGSLHRPKPPGGTPATRPPRRGGGGGPGRLAHTALSGGARMRIWATQRPCPRTAGPGGAFRVLALALAPSPHCPPAGRGVPGPLDAFERRASTRPVAAAAFRGARGGHRHVLTACRFERQIVTAAFRHRPAHSHFAGGETEAQKGQAPSSCRVCLRPQPRLLTPGPPRSWRDTPTASPPGCHAPHTTPQAYTQPSLSPAELRDSVGLEQRSLSPVAQNDR